MKVKDIMSSLVIKVDKDTDIKQVTNLMKEYDIGFIVVTDNDKVVGVITDRDIVIRDTLNSENNIVKDFMTTDVVTVNIKDNIKKALEKCAEEQICRLVVMNQDKLAGVISIYDILMSEHDDVLPCIQEIKSPLDEYDIDENDLPEIEVDSFEL